jgi:tryptophan synthase beta subunit
MKTGRYRRRTPFPQASITPASAPNIPGSSTRSASNYVSVTDAEALDAFQLCAKLEGIIPALEPSHAFAHVCKIAGKLPKDHILVMNMCGRGDKDIFTVAEKLGVKL